MAATEAKNPSAGGTAFQWISLARLPVDAEREWMSLIPAATTTAINESTAAPPRSSETGHSHQQLTERRPERQAEIEAQ